MSEKIESPRISVLLVEDEEGDARLILEYLKGAQEVEFAVTRVEEMREALQILSKQRFDVVLLDLNLPDAWGIDLFKSVEKECRETPFVLLTGTYRDEELAVEFLQLGAEDYLTKDKLSSELMLRTIRYAIERKKVKEELTRLNAELENQVRKWSAELERANERVRTLEIEDAFVATLSREFEKSIIGVKAAFDAFQNPTGTLAPAQAKAIKTGREHLTHLEAIFRELRDRSKVVEQG